MLRLRCDALIEYIICECTNVARDVVARDVAREYVMHGPNNHLESADLAELDAPISIINYCYCWKTVLIKPTTLSSLDSQPNRVQSCYCY